MRQPYCGLLYTLLIIDFVLTTLFKLLVHTYFRWNSYVITDRIVSNWKHIIVNLFQTSPIFIDYTTLSWYLGLPKRVLSAISNLVLNLSVIIDHRNLVKTYVIIVILFGLPVQPLLIHLLHLPHSNCLNIRWVQMTSIEILKLISQSNLFFISLLISAVNIVVKLTRPFGSHKHTTLLGLGMCFLLMDAPLASLSKSLLTPIYSTNEWFLPRVRIWVLYQVLLQREFLATIWALELLLDFVQFHVTLEGVFGFELGLAISNITQIQLLHFFSLNINLSINEW